ncbi:hypothetical protein H0264_14600 [Nocardia huaxiensis]|uniref:Uncharacterized protein n=1 Tax=Nocardia huaxiensis TaxID=2755382 RepID=A0A7D6ZGJ5_9NOCA|nr:hypothetical protein [Nocardia huaxiensis]QLY33298.1 hypothetical protein H0264_14600 [Nocardia huaxiensis]
MTARHRWVQDLILTTCRELGYVAIPEDPHTRADIFVTDPATALEVQLRPTAFRDRTESRRDKGADTIWFVSHDVAWRNASVREALTQLPSARFKIYDRHAEWRRDTPEFAPWDDLSGALDRYADMRILATIFKLDAAVSPPQLTRSGLSLRKFLDEVLSGQRRWIPPGEEGMPLDNRGRPRSGWVRLNELDHVRSAIRATAVLLPTPAKTETVRPTPSPSTSPPAPNALRPQSVSRPSDPPDDFDGCLALVVIAVVIIAIVALLWWLL